MTESQNDQLWSEIVALLDGPVSPTTLGPVGDDELVEVERNLGCQIPGTLRSLLAVTGGVCDDPDFGPRVVWPVGDLVEENMLFRANTRLENPTDFLCFGDDTAGNLFVMTVGGESEAVYVWNAIDDEVIRLADGMKQFIVGWINGELET